MPYTSKAQQRAMYAAKAGHSTLGIPKSVGEDFVAAGPSGKNLPERAPKKAPTHMDKLKHSNPRMIHPPAGEPKQFAPSFGRALRGALGTKAGSKVKLDT
jgi:hypothetical protein